MRKLKGRLVFYRTFLISFSDLDTEIHFATTNHREIYEVAGFRITPLEYKIQEYYEVALSKKETSCLFD